MTALQLSPVLDLKYIEQAYGEDSVIIYMIFDAFLSDSMPRWSALRTALATDDRKEAASLVHGLKPSFTMTGLTWIRPKVEELERAIKDQLDSATLQEMYEKIDAELQELTPVLESESARLKLL